MSGDNSHFFARRFQDFQRQTARGWICPECANGLAFTTEQKLWDHARSLHDGIVGDSRGGSAWKRYLGDALAKS